MVDDGGRTTNDGLTEDGFNDREIFYGISQFNYKNINMIN